MKVLSGRIDEIDMQMEKVRRSIEVGARTDPELGAGLATSQEMTAIERKIMDGLILTGQVEDTINRALRAA